MIVYTYIYIHTYYIHIYMYARVHMCTWCTGNGWKWKKIFLYFTGFLVQLHPLHVHVVPVQ